MGKRVSDIRVELLANPEVKAAYDAMAEEFEVTGALVAARGRAGLSQVGVAERTGVMKRRDRV
jgi:hypothetical protein